MIYREFQDLRLSALGMGAMRLPVFSSDEADVDVKAAEEMIDYAMAKGVNYYDTAWPYHGGKSETVLGSALKKYPREQFYLADKFPGYDLANIDKVESIFEEQLKKCQVSYFDFYLFHNVCEMNIDSYLDPKYRIFDYLVKQKKAGRIRHLGFSAHGNYDVMKRFLEAYGHEMEFCQIQLNYLDWKFQEADKKMELLREYHLPVWVMEPLRGGRLASLDQPYEEQLKALRPKESIPAWAFRFLQSLPEVTVVLSGMSNMEQLRANIETFGEENRWKKKKRRRCLPSPARWWKRSPFPVRPAVTASATVLRNWIFLSCCRCTTNIASPKAALSHPWRCLLCRQTSSLTPASAAETVRRYARSS